MSSIQEFKTPETVAPSPVMWEKATRGDFRLACYHHSRANIFVSTLAEVAALGHLADEEQSASSLSPRDDWDVIDEKYVHQSTHAAVNTAKQAAALEQLYQDEPGILAAVTKLNQDIAALAKPPLNQEGAERQQAIRKLQQAAQSASVMQSKVVVLQEAGEGEVTNKTKNEPLNKRLTDHFSNPDNQKRYAVIGGGLLIGGSVAVAVAFFFPAVAPTLVALLGLTGLTALIVPTLAVGLSGAFLGSLFLVLLERALGKKEDDNYVFMRNLVLATTVLGGIALGLLIGATSPVVLGLFVDLAALMTFTGPIATIGAFVMLGLAGLLLTAALVGLVFSIDRLITAPAAAKVVLPVKKPALETDAEWLKRQKGYTYQVILSQIKNEIDDDRDYQKDTFLAALNLAREKDPRTSKAAAGLNAGETQDSAETKSPPNKIDQQYDALVNMIAADLSANKGEIISCLHFLHTGSISLRTRSTLQWLELADMMIKADLANQAAIRGRLDSLHTRVSPPSSVPNPLSAYSLQPNGEAVGPEPAGEAAASFSPSLLSPHREAPTAAHTEQSVADAEKIAQASVGLPEGWQAVISTYEGSKGEIYYWNNKTDDTTWEKPVVASDTPNR